MFEIQLVIGRWSRFNGLVYRAYCESVERKEIVTRRRFDFQTISLEANINPWSGGYSSANAARAWAYLTSITVHVLYVFTRRCLSYS